MGFVSLSLRLVIGRSIKEKRERAQVQQEWLAVVGRQWGLPWSANTVAQLETGRRHLTVEEWLLLPVVLTQALNPQADYTYSDLLPQRMKELIGLTSRTSCYADGLRGLLGRHGVLTHQDADLFDRPKTRRLQAIQVGVKRHRTQAYPGTGGEADFSQADYKAARALGVTPNAILVASMRLWGQSLMEERDSRLAMAKTDKPVSRKTQALRGHITRILLQELRSKQFNKGGRP